MRSSTGRDEGRKRLSSIILTALTLLIAGECRAQYSPSKVDIGRTVGSVTISSRTVTNTLSQVILSTAANRTALECWAQCSNTDSIALEWGAVATSSSSITLEQCSYWSPPVVSTRSLNGISFTGSQVVRCVSY